MSEKHTEGTIDQKRMVQEKQGIRVNNLYYWANTL
jgi:hypothetical protein